MSLSPREVNVLRKKYGVPVPLHGPGLQARLEPGHCHRYPRTRRFFIKLLRILGCVVLGTVLGLTLPKVFEQYLPAYKYYSE